MPTFPPTARLALPEHYQRVFNSPKYKTGSDAFLLLAVPGINHNSRVGIIIAKKKIRRAVRRNQIKRMVREQFRGNIFEKPIDLVVLVRSGAEQMDNRGLWAELARLWCVLEKKVNS